MPRQRNNPSTTMKNQPDKTTQKGNKKSPENTLKDTEICDLNIKEFNMSVLKKINRMQENSDHSLMK